MSNTARKPLLLLFGILAIAAPALAGGPSLIRYPYKAGDHLPAVSPWVPDKILAFLDREDETLAHMAILSRIESSKVRGSFLDALKLRADDARTASEEAPSDASLKREAARRLFDYGFAGMTCGGSCNPSREPCFKMFEGSVRALGDDAAAWLALARAVHPGMKSGNLKEHAQAFVKAYDLAQAMPEGTTRVHLVETLQHDLEGLEAHLDERLKKAGQQAVPETRLALLRRITFGPPLCHPYKAGEPAGRLSEEHETLRRMELLRRDVCQGSKQKAVEELKMRAQSKYRLYEEEYARICRDNPKDDEERQKLMMKLKEVGRDLKMADFDYAFAFETLKYVDNGGGGWIRSQRSWPNLSYAVYGLKNDPAAWLALARACYPRMNSGNLKEHARAFVKAYDLTQALPEGVPRAHLIETLQYDLETLEGYLLDGKLKEAKRTPSPAERLAYLKKLAQDRR